MSYKVLVGSLRRLISSLECCAAAGGNFWRQTIINAMKNLWQKTLAVDESCQQSTVMTAIADFNKLCLVQTHFFPSTQMLYLLAASTRELPPEVKTDKLKEEWAQSLGPCAQSLQSLGPKKITLHADEFSLAVRYLQMLEKEEVQELLEEVESKLDQAEPQLYGFNSFGSSMPPSPHLPLLIFTPPSTSHPISLGMTFFAFPGFTFLLYNPFFETPAYPAIAETLQYYGEYFKSDVML